MKRGTAIILACALFACVGKRESYVHWTRYYEIRMGLSESRILFEESENRVCGWVTAAWDEETTHYDPTLEGCRPPWDLARHEACHRRLAHLYVALSTDMEEDRALKEAEVLKCERWYR